MTSKTVRMKVTVTFEYDANPDNYENTKPVDMADLDRMNFEEDYGHLLETMNDHPVTINVEPINGNP